jgi:hypothetical protein
MAIDIDQQQQRSYAQANENLKPVLKEFPVPPGSHPHDVAPATKSETIWYAAQGSGKLGRLDPTTGITHELSSLGLFIIDSFEAYFIAEAVLKSSRVEFVRLFNHLLIRPQASSWNSFLMLIRCGQE